MMPIPSHAVICCAGVGSRLGKGMPKCLVEINGTTLLTHQLQLLKNIAEVRIVVGYKKEDVIAEAKAIRPDAIFVHNDIYAQSSNAYSAHLGSHDLKNGFLLLDGDVLIDEKSFSAFLGTIESQKDLLCYTAVKTEDPIYAAVNGQNEITGFSRTEKTVYEWCGIAYIRHIAFRKDGKYLFDEIQPHLPVTGFNLDCCEIDTPQDYHLALEWLAA